MTTKAPDWEAIEQAYRAGSLSIRAIADKHGTNEGTIRSRAKKHGWLRDLTQQVKAATHARRGFSFRVRAWGALRSCTPTSYQAK